MPTTATECAQELARAYNAMMSHGFAVSGAAWEQTAAASRSLAEASQAEQAAAGQIWQQTIEYSRGRADGVAEITRNVANAPAGGVTEETRELIDGTISGDQQFFKSWTEYALGIEQRRAQLATEMLRSNAEITASSQDLIKSAMDCGRAFMDWSFAVARGASPTAPF